MRVAIFLNGPPGCGKDTAAYYLHNHHRYKIHKFTSPMDRALRAFFNLTREEYRDLREGKKDEPFITDISMRDILIAFSEKFAKPLFGQDILGILASQALDKIHQRVVFSDCGFAPEILILRPLIDRAAVIEISRPGHSFLNDSRSYISSQMTAWEPNFDLHRIENDAGLDKLYRGVEQVHRQLISRRSGNASAWLRNPIRR